MRAREGRSSGDVDWNGEWAGGGERGSITESAWGFRVP